MGTMFYKSAAACRESSESYNTKKDSDQVLSTCVVTVALGGHQVLSACVVTVALGGHQVLSACVAAVALGGHRNVPPNPPVPRLVRASRSVSSSRTAFAPW